MGTLEFFTPDPMIFGVKSLRMQALEQGNDRAVYSDFVRFVDLTAGRLLELFHGSIVNRYESTKHMTTLTSAQLEKFVKVRNKSGFTSNLQFQIDAEECGFKIADLPTVEKTEEGNYKWTHAEWTLYEENTPEGRKMRYEQNLVFLCMTQYAWGWGNTLPQAVGNCRSNCSQSTWTKVGYVVYLVHHEFSVSQIDGTVYVPQGAPPTVKVLDKIKPKAKLKGKTA